MTMKLAENNTLSKLEFLLSEKIPKKFRNRQMK